MTRPDRSQQQHIRIEVGNRTAESQEQAVNDRSNVPFRSN
jgi:hypothetical protein